MPHQSLALDAFGGHAEAAPLGTPSGKVEIYSPTIEEWGWPEHAMPETFESHVARARLGEDEVVLLPTFRLAMLIHSRSANAEWLYEISPSGTMIVIHY